MRCVFVTRQDIEWGKRVVLLESASEMYLRRLPEGVVESEIGSLLSSNIARPENGWVELRRRLCEDLSDGGILPVQMRFAVLGLEALRDDLTKGRYLKKGRDRGLISEHIEKEVRLVTGAGPQVHDVFRILNQLVSPDGRSAIPVPERELLYLLSEEDTKKVIAALEQLEKRDIIRRVSLGAEGAHWRLDHDYLADSVREIYRRQLPERAELKERYERFRSTSAARKPLALAGPVTLLRLLRAKFFKAVPFGEATTWMLFSASAVLALAACLLFATVNALGFWLDAEGAEKIFAVIGGGTLSQKAADALRRLSASDYRLRARFLHVGLESGQNAVRLESYPDQIAFRG